MKTQFLLVAGVLLAGIASAQTQKGNGILSGSFGVALNRSEGNSSTQTSYDARISVRYGQFVADDWLTGISIGGAYCADRSRGGNGLYKDHSFKLEQPIAVFVRRYWAVGPGFLFAGGGLRASVNTQPGLLSDASGNSTSTESTNYSVSPTVEVGGVYFLSKRIALEGTISGAGLPLGANGVNLGLVYWAGPTGTGTSNSESVLTTTNKGNWVIEGGFGVSGSAFNPRPVRVANSYDTYANVSLGRFVAANTLVGLSVGYSGLRQPGDGDSTSSRSFTVAPFVQKYLSNTRLTPFTRGSLFYGSSGRQVVDSNGSDDLFSSIGASVGVGLAYRISNRFLAETTLGSLNYTYGSNNKEFSNHSINLAAQLGSNLSLRYVIAGKR